MTKEVSKEILEVLKLVKKGKITLSKVSELAGLTIWEMIELIKEKKIDYVHISEKELEEQLKILKKL